MRRGLEGALATLHYEVFWVSTLAAIVCKLVPARNSRLRKSCCAPGRYAIRTFAGEPERESKGSHKRMADASIEPCLMAVREHTPCLRAPGSHGFGMWQVVSARYKHVHA